VECSDEHRLPGARFAGHRRETGAEVDVGGGDDAQVLDADRGDHSASPAGPLQPSTGSWNFRTSRSAKGPRWMRASVSGCADRHASMWARLGTVSSSRPSHQRTAVSSGWRDRYSTAMTDEGPVTRGSANRACALMGTMSSASTSGHTMGPPAENA